MADIDVERGKIYAILGDIYKEYVNGNLTKQAYSELLRKYEKKLRDGVKKSSSTFFNSLEFLMAFRNLRRRRARSTLAMLGIVVGVCAIVALASVSEGMRVQMTGWIKSSMGADLIIIGSGENQFMPEGKIPEEYVHQITGISIVDSAYPELFETGLVQGQTCLVKGVDPSAESHVSIVEGSYLDGEDLFEVVLGSKLRDRLGLSLGDMVTVSSASSNKDFKVVGVYQAMSMLLDEACMVPLEAAQQVFGNEGKASVILVNVKDVEKVDLAKAEIGRMLNGIQVIEQKEVLDTVQNGVTILKTFLLLVASISLLVAGLGIMNTMFMSVMERKREVGILKSIGTSKTQIMRIFLIESALLGAIGGSLGCIFGVGISKLAEVLATKYFAFPIATQTSVETLAFGLFFAVMASVISGLYPCWRAASLRPVEALKIE